MNSSPEKSQQKEARRTDCLHRENIRLGEQDSDTPEAYNRERDRARQSHPSTHAGKGLEAAKTHGTCAQNHPLIQNNIGGRHKASERRVEKVLATKKNETEQGKRQQLPSVCFEGGGHGLLS
ncbi:hypothetical protein [uncultured Ellagibacter sp.]|uniref:hypothetical protein n=1 Tax=uncultured Ellagibacter sp. TaxID=2137580 RepID=UPI002617DAAA|nr:hypothetical protein [uncultured Ellagibacter sp.]